MAGKAKYEKMLEIARDGSFVQKNPGERYEFIISIIEEDPELFFEFNRLTPDQFYDLLKLIKPYLPERSQSPGYCLSLALRYLSSCYDEISVMIFEVLDTEHDEIVNDVLNAIIYVLSIEVFSRSVNDIVDFAVAFDYIWHFPNCIGAIDVRSIIYEDVYKEGYEKYSENSFAFIANPFFQFLEAPVAIGCEDGQLFGLIHSRLLDEVNYIEVKEHPQLHKDLPLVLVGGSNCPLTHKIMRPIHPGITRAEEVIYNIRHNKAKSAVDISLGMLFKRWGIFKKPIKGSKNTVISVLNCAVVLHNWLLNHEMEEINSNEICESLDVRGLIDEFGYLRDQDWGLFSTTPGVTPLLVCNKRESRKGNLLRLIFRRYFLEEGNIPAPTAAELYHNPRSESRLRCGYYLQFLKRRLGITS